MWGLRKAKCCWIINLLQGLVCSSFISFCRCELKTQLGISTDLYTLGLHQDIRKEAVSLLTT